MTATLPGWPVNCALGLAGLPRPHDPHRAVRGQDWSEQVPQRRAVADGVVSELADTGHQDAEQYAEAQRWRAMEMGDTGLEPVPPRLIDLRQPLGPGDPAQAVVGCALSEAWKLAAAAKPPPGSVRVRKSWPSGRVIRATGSDWTLVARTGTPPLLVLIADDAPRGLLDVSGADSVERAHGRPHRRRSPLSGQLVTDVPETNDKAWRGWRSRRDHWWRGARTRAALAARIPLVCSHQGPGSNCCAARPWLPTGRRPARWRIRR